MPLVIVSREERQLLSASVAVFFENCSDKTDHELVDDCLVRDSLLHAILLAFRDLLLEVLVDALRSQIFYLIRG